LAPIKDIDPTKALPIAGWFDDRRLTADDWQNIKPKISLHDEGAGRISPRPVR